MWISFIRNASCSQGWLRWVVQLFFGIIIVTSFILILIMALTNSKISVPKPTSRCRVRDCRVVCTLAPYFDDFEDDVIEAAWQADATCESIILTLKEPHFTNKTLPQKWLSGTRTNVNELAIVGGNLQHIAPRAFMSQFSNNIQTLILENIQLTTWGPETFVGLSSLKQLYIKDCMFINITRNALQAVDDTLEFLDIKASFMWNPAYITGSANLARLKVVDFAINPFYNILDKSSFSELRMCTTLFLNSCRLTALGKGTFDSLDHIEILYLNDNYLVTIPSGFFDRLLPLRPRIAIHDNFWHCNCSDFIFRNLLTKDVLIVDPICRYPDDINGLTFSDFNYSCQNKSNHDSQTKDRYEKDNITNCDISKATRHVNINDFCHQENNFTDKIIQVITSTRRNGGCRFNVAKISEIQRFWMDILNNSSDSKNGNWLNPIYSVQSNHRSMVELSSSSTPGQGLLWYQTSCPHEIYCLNNMPDTLRIFDSNLDIRYAFCPFDVHSGDLNIYKCVTYRLSDIDNSYYTWKYSRIFDYVIISIMCSITGAICIYALIHCNPQLLKGNKRILFVKHKKINALILPPDVPVRKDTLTDFNLAEKDINKLFLISNQQECQTSLERSFSFKSSKSNEVSYISALQPTDEQLAQWRIREYNKRNQYDSLRSDKLSSIFDAESLAYYSLKEFHDTPLETSKK